jgi:hypothetical protein
MAPRQLRRGTEQARWQRSNVGYMKICKKEKNLFNVLYSDPELLNRIRMSEWVKWQPCRGYGRLLAAVAMPTVLEIFIFKIVTC